MEAPPRLEIEILVIGGEKKFVEGGHTGNPNLLHGSFLDAKSFVLQD
jgi:hypothetical protein